MTRFSRLAFRSLELAFGLVFLTAVAHHVMRSDLRPLVGLAVPLLMVFYGFASVLFVRGRSMAPGLWQTRSLYAAERAMQATVWHLVGMLLGLVVYSALKHLALAGPWLALYLAPYALMQVALICFLRGIWALAPDLFRPAGALAVARRIRQPS